MQCEASWRLVVALLECALVLLLVPDLDCQRLASTEVGATIGDVCLSGRGRWQGLGPCETQDVN